MQQLRIQTQSEAAEQIEELLFNCGAISVSYEDAADEPILEPKFDDHPLWSKLFIQALFTDEQAVLIATKALENNSLVQQHIILKQVAKQDWQASFQQQFSAMQFGPLWIYPSWEDNPAPDGLSLQLDPGLAFGTGHHATTHLCLEWISVAELADLNVVDYGCGSGILALATHKLGAKHVHAVDLDPQALLATRKNIQRNQLPATRFTLGGIECLQDQTYDIIIANILAAPLLALRNSFHALLTANGAIVISGILESQIQNITDHYAEQFRVQNIYLREEWACISFARL